MAYNDYLYHHGVKGMKWGIRHDPQSSGRRTEKAIKYKNKLQARAQKKSNYGLERARDLHREYKDLKKNGVHSESWQMEVERRSKESAKSINKYSTSTTAAESLIDVGFSFLAAKATESSLKNNKRALNQYKYEVAAARDNWSDYARKWQKSSNALRNTYVTSSMKKRDIRRTYRSGESVNPYRG